MRSATSPTPTTPSPVLEQGDAIWDAPPTDAALVALEATADELPDLAGLVALAGDHGYEVAHGHVSTLAEWDEYEWSWTGSLADWSLAEGRAPDDRAEALGAARAHRDAWLGGYRGVLGFATLVLVDAGGSGDAGVSRLS